MAYISHTFRVPYTTSKYAGTRYMNIEAEYHQEAMDLVESMVPDCTSVHHPTVIETHNSDHRPSSSSSSSGGGFGLILIGCIVIFGLNVFSSNNTSTPSSPQIEQVR